MIQVQAYSPKGLLVKGATAEQAEAIRVALGANVAASYNAKLGGWAFSRKREDRIRDLVRAMAGDGSGDATIPPDPDPAPDVDGLPGKWGLLAG